MSFGSRTDFGRRKILYVRPETEARLLAFIMDFRICLKISWWSFCPVSLWFRRKTAIPFTGNLSGICQMIASFLPLQREEIASAVKELAGLGFYVEPTSAAAYAGLLKLLQDGVLNETSDVIMMVSGNGLKASTEIAGLLGI